MSLYTPSSLRSSYYSRPQPSSPSSLIGRTTSLDRSSYSYSSPSYGTYSPYTSSSPSYASKYSSSSTNASKPPRPSYSSTESYRSRINRDPPSYSRNTSETRDVDTDYRRDSIGRSASARSRILDSGGYSASTVASRLRDSSTSRDSGYGSRVTSRDRSADIRNSNGLDGKAYGPSVSSYASTYRWEGKDKESSEKDELNDDLDKISVNDRIGIYEKKEPDIKSRIQSRCIIEERADRARIKREEERLTARRERLGLDNYETSARSRTPEIPTKFNSGENRLKNSNECNGNDSSSEGHRPSIGDIRRKYENKSLVNGSESNDENKNSGYSNSFSTREESPIVTRRRTDSRSSARGESPYAAVASSNGSLDVGNRREESNGQAEKSKYLATNGTLSKNEDSSRGVGGNRRDRVKERIAARVARELDDDDALRSGRSDGSFSEACGLVGLRNIGNTCYLNSILQCLSNTRCLLEYLTKDAFLGDLNTSPLSSMKGDLMNAFASLIKEMWAEGDSNRAINTGPFKTQVQRFASVFSGYQQHDAQEFLRKLLEGLHEDVNRVTVRPKPLLTDIDDDLSDDGKAMEAWKRYIRYDDSKLVDMFVGVFESKLRCTSCNYSSLTFDPFWDLSLELPSKTGNIKLQQCLDRFTADEILDGDEKPKCSKCKERVRMTKSFSIQKFPKVLVLHLKRFSPTERWRGKLSNMVEFPLENLDLSRYASSNCRSPHTYNLLGVANHSGTTYSGHYMAYCKHPYQQTWHEYNDSRVTSIPPKRVCSPEAYVLFYELCTL